MSGDKATVSVTVAVPQATAFEVFTQEIDLWWRRGPRFRFLREPGQLSFEATVGGRLFELFTSASGLQVREVGHVTVWESPARRDGVGRSPRPTPRPPFCRLAAPRLRPRKKTPRS